MCSNQDGSFQGEYEEHVWEDQSTVINTGAKESQTHVLVCPGYSDQREGVDLGTMDGLIKYYREVVKIRFED